MKKILFLGDSIMYGAKGLRGYGYFVGERLKGQASVYLPTDNCQDSRYLCAFLEELIPASDGDYDIIHWNNGLWDLLHFMGNPRPYVLIEDYARALTAICERLRGLYPRAEIFFATTTVVPERLQKASSYRRNAEIAAYNAAACSVLSGRVDAFDDLYAVSLTIGDEYRAADGLHYSEAGAQLLADAVCRFLRVQGNI